MLLAVMCVFGAGTAWGAEEVYKTALFGSDYNSQSIGSYTATWTATNDDFTVSLANFNNNNNSWNYVKCGRKNTASVATITTKEAIDKAITKVVVTIDALTADKVNSIKLYISSDNETWTEAGSFSIATGAQEVALSSPAANLYYKVEFDCASGSANGLVTVSKVEYYYSPSNKCALPTFNPTAGTYTSTQNVEITCATTGATIYYTTDGSNPTESSASYSTPISVSSTTTIKAMAVKEELENSSIATATYTIVDFEHAGTEQDPYTVADARNAIDASVGVTEVYATGIVSSIVTAYNSTYGNITFDIIDEGSDATLRAYRCTGDDAANVQEGDEVVVSGNLTKYNSTYEFAEGCTLISLTHPTSTDPVINAKATLNLAYDATSGEIAYTIENPVEGTALSATLQEGIDWITDITVGGESVTFTTTANESDADRTANITLSYEGAEDVTVTVTQAHYVADFATLSFEFDGGKADIENTAGLTQSGLGGDYGSSPKLKFDNTDDYLILKFNERPGVLTFDIKGNSFSGGTFTVQTSEDGEEYTDVATYSTLGDTETKTISNLGENVRYIKWIYTNKSNGNVALGNINLAKYGTIVLEDYTLTIDDPANATITATYGEEVLTNGEDADVTEGTEVSVVVTPAEGYVFESITIAGEGEEQTITPSESNGVYTFTMPAYDVTISATITEYVAPVLANYTLATSITSGKRYVIASGTEGSVKVMGDQAGNNRPAVDATITDGVLAVSDEYEFVIESATNGYTIHDESTESSGYLYAASSSANQLKTEAELDENNNGLWSITFDEGWVATVVAQGTNTRKVMQYNSGSSLFACYGSASQKPVYLFEKVEAPETVEVTISAAGAVSFSSKYALDFSESGLTANIVTEKDGSSFKSQTVTVVPEETGLVVEGEEGTYQIPVAAADATFDDVEDNLLVSTASEAYTVTSDDYGFVYGLFKSASTGKVGFQKKKVDFTFGIGKSYLRLPATSGAKGLEFIYLNEVVTGIKTVGNEQMNGDRYNLNGQRVDKNYKGVVIVNGKKMINK